jgi:membrane protein YqaA with SNARE-associated domain
MWKSLSAKLGQFLLLYGWGGLFAMSFLDSSLIPFPVVNDLALIVMASKRPALWPFYSLSTTLGSVAGAYLLYGVARAGSDFFWRKVRPHHLAHARRWLERNEFVAILVASLLPPPAPLKVFLLTAGLLRVNALQFGLALLVGRGLRFGTEGWLGARYGMMAETYIRHNLVWVSAAVIGGIVLLALLQRRFLSADAPNDGTNH